MEDGGRTITIGGTTIELTYHGPNHSDSTLVMRLPKEKLAGDEGWPRYATACRSSRGAIAASGAEGHK